VVYIVFKCRVPRHRLAEFHQTYEEQMKLLERNGGKVIGVWDIDMGPSTEFMLMWAARDLAHYERTLESTRKDPDGEGLRQKFLPLISDCERWLLKPTSYSPLQ